jgi:hypothetical protein
VIGELNERQMELTTALGTGDQFTIQPPTEAPARETPVIELPAMSAFMKSIDMESVIHSGKLATRRAYGIALRALGRNCKEVVVAGRGCEQLDLCGDVREGRRAWVSVCRVQDRRAEHDLGGGGDELRAGRSRSARPSRSS